MVLSNAIILLTHLIILSAVVRNDAVVVSGKRNLQKHPDFTINKVSLTQKGYIQFLRYINEVPPIRDYTFCIWLRSSNLTYNHPILSYSKHEEERLIRVWVTLHGKNISLEILGEPVFQIPVEMVENHWYHVCQSWSSNQGAWNLYFNGKLKANGFVPKLRGVVIKGAGDIVVGQEYTDFDKGLDDGIEGDIFGFNFVLSSTSGSLKIPSKQPSRRQFVKNRTPDVIVHSPTLNLDERNLQIMNPNRVPSVRNDSNPQTNRNPKTFLNIFDMFREEPIRRNVIPVHGKFYRRSPMYRSPSASTFNPSRISNEIHEMQKPLGLQLVELSFDCSFKKGAPLSGKGVLVNWTRSPVRVFGGAILKSVAPFCT